VKARLEAVQGVFRAVVIASLLLGALAFPRGDNAALMTVLEELTTFEQAFDRATLERQLLAGVRAQGELSLELLAKQVTGPGVPKVEAAADAAPLGPRAQLELGSLEAVHRLGSGSATVAMASVDAELLAASLAWRLARDGEAEAVTLLAAKLTDAAARPADLERERQIVEARATLLQARNDAERTTKHHTEADELYRARMKWKAHWRSIANADEKRKEAELAMQTAATALQQAESRYTELTRAADAFKPGGTAVGEQGTVELQLQRGGKPLTLNLPAQLALKPAPVPALTGTSFAATHAAGLWDQLKGGSAAAGIAQVRSMFTWHYRYVDLGGFKLGGMTLLTFAPLGLLWLLLTLVRRSRRVSGSYNPFNRPGSEELPTVGLGAAPLDLLALVVLPLASSVLCAWSLIAVRQFSAGLPILCGLGAIALGIWGQLELRELRSLREAIQRSHSQPPGAPAE
jgi:hypothetical protein